LSKASSESLDTAANGRYDEAMSTHVGMDQPAVPADSWHGLDPFAGIRSDDPYPALAHVRETAPVHRTPIGIWRLFRYADVVRLLRDVPTGVRTTAGILPFVDEISGGQREFMLQQDPPAHTRLRRLVSRAFTPRAVERIRGRVEAIVDECLARVASRGEMDVIADLALPVPATVICEMLGVPFADHERFTRWTAEATHGLAAATAPPDVLARARAAGEALTDYFVRLIEERRGALGDDLLSEMIRAEEAGDRLSTSELVSQSIGLLIAGFETTIGLIGNGVRALLRHPAELARLRAEPALIGSAVEECLRYDGPIQMTVRVVHDDVAFGEHVIPRDTVVWALLGAANRDPERFPDPERFDVGRNDDGHLAFGGATHFCLGAHLARLEARAAIGAFVARFDEPRLVSESVEWGPSLFRVPGRLPITFRAAR